MKTVFLLLLFPLFSKAQVLPEKDNKILYTDVVTVDSVSKDELFNRAKIWFVSDYVSPKDILQLQDKDAGILVCKGGFPAAMSSGLFGPVVEMDVTYTLKLYFKDGKYKYEITDIPVSNEVPGFDKKAYTKMLVQVDDTFKHMIGSLKDAMNAPVTANDF